MRVILKILVFIVFCTISFLVLIIHPNFYGSNLILRQPFGSLRYVFWAKVNGEKVCTENISDAEKQNFYDSLGTFSQVRINVLYLTEVDIVSCAPFIQSIATKLHEKGILLAMNIDRNIDKNGLLGDDLSSVKLEYFENKLQNIKDKELDRWVSYFVVTNSMNLLTYQERRAVLLKLREFFASSFIGFEFVDNVVPTPANTHPLRENTQWQDFLPQEDEGDFIITKIPVSGLKRTFVVADNVYSTQTDGILLDLNARL